MLDLILKIRAAIDRFEDSPLCAVCGAVTLFELLFLGLVLTGAK